MTPVDLDTGVMVAVPIHAADEGYHDPRADVGRGAEEPFGRGLVPTKEDPCDLIADNRPLTKSSRIDEVLAN